MVINHLRPSWDDPPSTLVTHHHPDVLNLWEYLQKTLGERWPHEQWEMCKYSC